MLEQRPSGMRAAPDRNATEAERTCGHVCDIFGRHGAAAIEPESLLGRAKSARQPSGQCNARLQLSGASRAVRRCVVASQWINVLLPVASGGPREGGAHRVAQSARRTRASRHSPAPPASVRKVAASKMQGQYNTRGINSTSLMPTSEVSGARFEEIGWHARARSTPSLHRVL